VIFCSVGIIPATEQSANVDNDQGESLPRHGSVLVVSSAFHRLRASAYLGAFGAYVRSWWSGILFPGEPAPEPRRTWVYPLVLGLLAALLLFSELDHPLLDPDEGRQAEVPREMLAHGDLLRPRMLGQPYYEKPPLQYWLTAGAYTLFGLDPWAARLVPALSAWLIVQGTYAWGRRTLGSRPAFLGALGLCLTPGFVVAGRTVVLDSLLTACVVTSWFTAHFAVSRADLRRKWWAVSAVASGLGLLAKGPVALILLIPPVLAYQLLVPTAARPRLASWGAYLGRVALVAAPWYAVMAFREPDYVAQFLWRANVVRFVNPYDHEQPWWFYLPILFALTFPWSLLWPASGYFLFRRALARLRTPGLGFCVLAAGWCLMFFSASGCKSLLYVVPALPPLALLLGTCLDSILFRPGGRDDPRLDYARRWLPYGATLVILWTAAGGCVAGVLLDWQDRAVTLGEAVVLVAAAALWWRFGRAVQPTYAWGACAVATTLVLVIPARDLVEGYSARHSLTSVAPLIRRWPNLQADFIVSYARQWPSASFYARRDVIPFFDHSLRQSLIDFLETMPETLVLVESGPPLQELLNALPDGLKAEVRLPRREGQAALLIVRQRPRSQEPVPDVAERLDSRRATTRLVSITTERRSLRR
jgi:dolichol-phosphate mannosyltransferase